MNTEKDPFDNASALLRKAALEIKQGHTLIGTDQWDLNTDAKAAHDSYMATAAALDAAAQYVEEMLDRIEGKVDSLLTSGNMVPAATRQWTVEDARAFTTSWIEQDPPTAEIRFAWFMLEAKGRAKNVYVAGPMTGLPDLNFPAFHAAAAQLRAQGLHVENPAEHGEIEGAEWGDYLRYDIGRLATCGAIYLLKGWENSKGAQLEVHIARTLDMVVMYAPGAMSVLQAELRQKPAPVVHLPAGGVVFSLLEEVSSCFTRDDDLPNDLLPRIDAVLAAKDGK
ncbi:MAG: DUF4406 domain-containing protein [Acidovorax sp.]|uniref:DUF4406 domain-containing protein n=1 Tax=Acidovorax sp. TaxID=1872122 RepID=UPI002623307F|nr:DUF4406 domain-containing protein [Acidovorax sp.]MDH4425099.1 DUF4406 domain-containing protein [Acidovorax sp.]